MRNQDSTVIPIRLSYGALVLVALAAGGCTLPDDCPNGWCAFEEEQWFDALEDLWVDPASGDAWAVGYGGLAVHYDGQRWRRVETGVGGELRAVWGADPANVWAVGEAGLLKWDGFNWTVIDERRGLQDVAGRRANDVYVTGWGDTLLHWDGRRWSEVEPPEQGDVGWLNEDGMFVAPSGELFLAYSTVLLRWDGSSWTWSAVPRPGIQRLFGFSGADLWGFRNGALLHFDGTTWTEHLFEGASIDARAVWGSSSCDLWVSAPVGLLHWDCAAWTAASTPAKPGAIAGRGAGDAWATSGRELLRLDGGEWSLRTPGTTTRPLFAIWAASPTEAWAGGYEGTLLHWDGSRWSSQDLPTFSTLYSLSGTGPGDVWAVGGPSTTNGANGAWHFDGTAWSQVATAEPWRLHGVVALAPDDAVVFGDYTVQRWNGAALVTEAIAPDDVQWRAGAASAPDDLWIVGYAGRVGHWDGAAWSVTRLGDGSEDLLAVQAVSASEVWVGSQAGSLWRWDGEAWTRIELKDPHRRFSRIDTLTGDAQRGLWAFGSTQWRLGTFGWETPLVRSASRVNAAAIVGDEVWAVGENGLILRHSR